METILLIDDDELILIALRELFEGEGFEVETAASGPEGLSKLAGRRFDLIILDIIMPGMSGFEVCRRIREAESLRQTPVLMLTAKHTPADREKGLEAGANLFLPKPIDPEQLLVVVKGAVSGAERVG